MSTDDLKYICTLLKEARNKSSENAEYESSLSIFETVQKLLTKAMLNADPNLTDKVVRLRDICRCETRLLREYIAEKNNFSLPAVPKGSSKNSQEVIDDENDPDVWAPPTPQPKPAGSRQGQPLAGQGRVESSNNRNAGANAWGIQRRQSNDGGGSAAPIRAKPVLSSDVNNRAEQMRKERDAANVNRHK